MGVQLHKLVMYQVKPYFHLATVLSVREGEEGSLSGQAEELWVL